MRLVSLDCIMPPPDLEAREDFVIKHCNTTDPEVFTHHGASGADGFEIVLRKKIFSARKLYGVVLARQGVALINLVGRNGARVKPPALPECGLPRIHPRPEYPKCVELGES
jgi:hypothetical protein